MKITILTVGTLGDVQPYVALGIGLKQAGHTVTIATDMRFAALVTERGLEFAPLHADFLRLLETEEGRAALDGGKGRLGLTRRVMPMLRRVLDDAWAAAQDSEAIVYHPKVLGGYHIAERLSIPGFLAHPVPMFSPTSLFPNPILPPGLRLGGWFNRLSYSVLNRLIILPYHGLINGWRRDVLGLPALPLLADEFVQNGQPVPRLYGCSPHVVPVPEDWDSATTMTGYWFLDRKVDWSPPADLVDFLAAGPTPAYVGFGSMVGRDSARAGRTVLAALERAGLRAVIAAGAGGIAGVNRSTNVFPVEQVPHDWLFPRVAAVVHHGGAGTTAAGLRAGIPTVVCPFFGDQPFWGKRVHELGVGPKPIPQKGLTVERLAEAIATAVADAGMRDRAEALGRRIRSEDGVAKAVGVIIDRLL